VNIFVFAWGLCLFFKLSFAHLHYPTNSIFGQKYLLKNLTKKGKRVSPINNKKNNLINLAKRLSAPTKQQSRINLDELNKQKEKNVIIVGKVLGSGEIKQKMTVSALGFSEQAREKLKKAGCELHSIKQEIERNKKLEGVKIL